MKHHEKEAAEAEMAFKAAISPNQLRGQVGLHELSDDEDEAEGKPSGADWGKRARRRQRDVAKKLLEANEKRLEETFDEEQDKDIEEFLIPE